MHLTLRRGLGGLTWQRDGGIISPAEIQKPKAGLKLGESEQRPRPCQHNIPPDRQNKLHSQSQSPRHADLKTSSHYLTSKLQRLHTLSAQCCLCCERHIGGSGLLITPSLLFVSIFLSHFIIESKAPLSPHPTSKTLKVQNWTNSSDLRWWMDVRCLYSASGFRRGNTHTQNRAGFQELVYAVVGLDKVFTVCLKRIAKMYGAVNYP